MKRTKGFTYLELVVVILVIAVLSSVTLPSMRGVFVGNKLKTSARELYTMLKYAQGSAVFQREIVELRIDTAKERYRLVPNDEEKQTRHKKKKYSRINATVNLPKQVSLATVQTPISDRRHREIKSIFFYPDGSSSGAEIILKGKNNRTFLIIVYRTTGFIELIKDPQNEKEYKFS